MYTSGTTGTPKGVPLTHGNIVGELSGVNDILGLSDKERILSLLPLFHAYLQIVNLWVATTFGPQVGYLKELTPAELSESMKVFKPTILTTVPRLWYIFHKKIFDAVDSCACVSSPITTSHEAIVRLPSPWRAHARASRSPAGSDARRSGSGSRRSSRPGSGARSAVRGGRSRMGSTSRARPSGCRRS